MSLKKIGEEFGVSEDVERVIKKMTGNLHKCPQCNGSGIGTTLDECCDLCDGQGYTEKKYRPKMVQCGWEVDEDKPVKETKKVRDSRIYNDWPTVTHGFVSPGFPGDFNE